MKRSKKVALGTLMACLITGTAFAAVIDVRDGSTSDNPAGEYAGIININSVVGVNGSTSENITFIKKGISAGIYTSIYTVGTDEKIAKTTISGNIVTFNGDTASGYTGAAANNFAGWQNGNTSIEINANELYVGSEEKGGDRGFQFKNANNILNINANKVVAYVGDGFINAQGDGSGTSVANIGTADNRIGHFEAHTTFGKDDYGVALLQANEGNTVNLYADTAILDGSRGPFGGVIGSGGYGTVNVDAKNLTIDGNICGSYGGRTDKDKTALLKVTADTLTMKGDINVGSADADNSNFSRNTIVEITANKSALIDGSIKVSGNAGNKDNSNDISKLDIVFNGDSQITGDIIVAGVEGSKEATVNLGGTGDMTASKGAYNVTNGANVNFTGGTWAIKNWEGTDGNTSIAQAATVDVTASNMQTKNMKLDGTMNLKGDGITIVTGSLTGDGATVTTNSLNNSLTATNSTATNVAVKGTSAVADAIAAMGAEAGLKELAGVVTTTNDKSVASTVSTEEGAVAGAFSAKVDENGGIVTNSVKETVNTTNAGIADMASLALVAWRAENNDMNKRLGELRNSNGERGIWTRMVRGESEYNSVKNQYNTYQLGYDEKLSTDKSWTVGAAISYTEGDSSYSKGTGENKHKGFSIYGSKLNEDGSFIDLIAKYARLDHEYTVAGGIGNSEYEANGYSVSAEYGKRFTKDNGFWIEPQVELTYGTVGSASYKAQNGFVDQDSMDSLVGRIGFSLGKNIKQGNVYARASYLYDFDGETNIRFTDSNNVSRSMEQDLGGGWFEVGVGTNINLSKATYLYADVERTFGGEVDTPWQYNVGVRYSF